MEKDKLEIKISSPSELLVTKKTFRILCLIGEKHNPEYDTIELSEREFSSYKAFHEVWHELNKFEGLEVFELLNILDEEPEDGLVSERLLHLVNFSQEKFDDFYLKLKTAIENYEAKYLSKQSNSKVSVSTFITQDREGIFWYRGRKLEFKNHSSNHYLLLDYLYKYCDQDGCAYYRDIISYLGKKGKKADKKIILNARQELFHRIKVGKEKLKNQLPNGEPLIKTTPDGLIFNNTIE